MVDELIYELYNVGPTFLAQLKDLQTGVIIGVGLIVLFFVIGLLYEIKRA